MRAVWQSLGQTRAAAPWLLALLWVLLLARPSAAQTAEPARAEISAGQPRIQVTLSPGASAEGELSFTNDGPAPVYARPLVMQVKVGADGQMLQPADGGDGTGAARWISLAAPNVVLRPAASTAVRYRVQVPPDVAPGDYSAFVALQTDRPGPPSGVRLTVNVPGTAQPRLELLGFGARREPFVVLGQSLPNQLPLYEGGPISFQTRVRNDGNFVNQIAGAVELVDLFGNLLARIDLPADQVAPGDVATFTTVWNQPPAVGWVTARVGLGGGGLTVVSEERLVVLPWQQVAAALLFAIALRLLLGRGFTLPVPERRKAETERQTMTTRVTAFVRPDRPTHLAMSRTPDGELKVPSVPLSIEAAAEPGEPAEPGPATSDATVRLDLPTSPTPPTPTADEPDGPPDLAATVLLTLPPRTEAAAEPAEVAAVEPAEVPAEAPAVVTAAEPAAAVDDPALPAEPTEEPVEEPAEPPAAAPTVTAAVPIYAPGPAVPAPYANGWHSTPSVAELFDRGRAAARAGDGTRAHQLFVQVVELAPNHEEAWLWRAGTAERESEAIDCLRRVIALNPGNERARQGLEEMQQRLAVR